ncbi:glucanase B [Biscogniauxia mediterranea]|nr:glucanase B [Biscogniauxia mediterranea]
MTPATINFSLNNNTGSNVYAYIVGRDYSTKWPLFIQADGKTVYHPAEPSERLQPLETDCAIALDRGNPTTVTIPQMISGRLYFCLDSKLTFSLNPKDEDDPLPGPGVVQPSVLDPTDVNNDLNWTFVEFTYDPGLLFANITYADWVSWPISLQLRNTSNAVQTVQGLSAGALDKICEGLIAQEAQDGAGWSKLIVKGPDGKPLRVLSPNLAVSKDATLFEGYYQAYVDKVWSKYSDEDLKISLDEKRAATGRVVDGLLAFDDGHKVPQPSAVDIFSCNKGAFAETQGDAGILNRNLAAACNRSTLLIDSNLPENEDASTYYKSDPTNHYARILHELNIDGRGYAFPYDDVRPSNAANTEGSVSDTNPDLLMITLKAPGDSAAA